MPDPDRKTISATESPALFGVSPYLTRWMLYQRFANGVDISPPANSRMEWGLKMQPLILQQVASDKKLEVIPNDGDVYLRRGRLGCTRDATIICPDRGPGALEIKCVFDIKSWMQTWGGGNDVPRHYEIQLQHQMAVGQSDTSFNWGIIAVWFCADLFYFERRALIDLWQKLADSAREFFDDVDARREPDPFGNAVELPWLNKLYPIAPDKTLDLSADETHFKTSQAVCDFKKFKEDAEFNATAAEMIRVQLLALAKDAEYVKLPCGVSYRVRKSGKGKSIVPILPEGS